MFVTIELHIHRLTAAAILVSTTGDRDDSVWVPLSLVKDDREVLHSHTGEAYEITLRESIAYERGLI